MDQMKFEDIEDYLSYKIPSEIGVVKNYAMESILEKLPKLDYTLLNEPVKVSSLREELKSGVSKERSDEINTTLAKLDPTLLVKYFLLIKYLYLIANKSELGFGIFDGMTYCFNGRFWEEVDEVEVMMFLVMAAQKSGLERNFVNTPPETTKLLNQFKTHSHIPLVLRQSSSDAMLNLLNGTVYFENGEVKIKYFSKNDFLRYQLNFKYDKTAKAEKFMKFLNKALPEKNAQKNLQRFIGSLFVPSLKLEKALLIYGEGATGKSTFWAIITALVGRNNMTFYPLERLIGSDQASAYNRARLNGKILNYATEIGNRISDTAMAKQLISGESMDARNPYGKPFEIHTIPKLIFNCNNLPTQSENSNAFKRRLLIAPFLNTIPENERNLHLAEEIIAEEMSGVLNWVIEGMQDLIKEECFVQSDAMDKCLDEYQKESNNVYDFLDYLSYVKTTTEKISLKNLFELYLRYCKMNNHNGYKLNNFVKRLESLGITVGRKETNNSTNVYIKIIIPEDLVLSDPFNVFK